MEKITLVEATYRDAIICDDAVWVVQEPPLAPIGILKEMWDKHRDQLADNFSRAIARLAPANVMLCVTDEYLEHYRTNMAWEFKGDRYICDIDEVIAHWERRSDNIVIDMVSEVGYFFTPDGKVVNRLLHARVWDTSHKLRAIQEAADSLDFIRHVGEITECRGKKYIDISYEVEQEALQEAVDRYFQDGLGPEYEFTEKLFGQFLKPKN